MKGRPALWACALWLCLASAGALAAEPPAGSLRLPAILETAGGVTGDLFARVALRKVKYSRVLARKALALPPSDGPWAAGDAAPRRARLADGASGLNLAGFNEAHLDYLAANPALPGCLGFAAVLRGGGARTAFVSDPLETVDRLEPAWVDSPRRDAVDVAGADWAPKGLRYQLARFLDREPDALWRYSQDGPSTFVQRRFARDITDVGAVDVVLLRGQEVQVNLVVSLDPAGKGRTVLDWYALPKRTFDLGDGRSLLRLYVGRHLRALAPGTRAVRLKEAALMFFRQDQERVTAERNVEKLLFVPSGLPEALTRDGLPRDLPARAREIFAGRGELAANLSVLGQAPWDAMALESLDVVWSPSAPEEPFELDLEGARLARVAPRRDVPAVLAAMAERCASFGAQCDMDAPDGFVDQDPLWSLDFTPLADPGGRSRPVVHPALAEGLLRTAGRARYTAEPDGLGVACQGGLTLETGAAFTPAVGATVSLWLELGARRQGLGGIRLEAWGGGRTVSVAVKPGLPAVLPELPGRVEGVRLRFEPQDRELFLTLQRAVLQATHPGAPRRGLYEARTLFGEAVPAVARQDGPRELRFDVQALPASPRWLVADLSAPAWTVHDAPPVLRLDYAGRALRAALPAASARVAFLLPEAPLSSRAPLRLSLEGGSPQGGLSCQRALLAGERLASWPEVLGGQSLLEAQGAGFHLEGLDPAGAGAMASSARWMPMGGLNLSGGEQAVRFVKNPWLEVEAVLLDRLAGPELTRLGNASEAGPASGGRGGKLPALALALACGAALWLGLRGGRAGRLARGFAGWLDGAPPEGGRGESPWFWAVLMAASLAAGFVLGGPGARLAGMAGSLAAVPLWRALRPRVARLLPVVAKRAALHYCTGFLAAVCLAAALRAAGLPPLSEFLGLCGMWLFVGAWAVRLRPDTISSGSGA